MKNLITLKRVLLLALLFVMLSSSRPFWGKGCDLDTFTDENGATAVFTHCCTYRLWINFGNCEDTQIFP